MTYQFMVTVPVTANSGELYPVVTVYVSSTAENANSAGIQRVTEMGYTVDSERPVTAYLD